MKLEYRQEIDGPIYDELTDFLPEHIFDSHIHTALPEHITPMSEERKISKLGFFLDVASVFGYNPYEFAQEVRLILFPDQRVEGLYFGYPFPETDLDANNAYVAGLIRRHGVPGLFVPRADAERDELARESIG